MTASDAQIRGNLAGVGLQRANIAAGICVRTARNGAPHGPLVAGKKMCAACLAKYARSASEARGERWVPAASTMAAIAPSSSACKVCKLHAAMRGGETCLACWRCWWATITDAAAVARAMSVTAAAIDEQPRSLHELAERIVSSGAIEGASSPPTANDDGVMAPDLSKVDEGRMVPSFDDPAPTAAVGPDAPDQEDDEDEGFMRELQAVAEQVAPSPITPAPAATVTTNPARAVPPYAHRTSGGFEKHCAICDQVGHNARTCPARSTARTPMVPRPKVVITAPAERPPPTVKSERLRAVAELAEERRRERREQLRAGRGAFGLSVARLEDEDEDRDRITERPYSSGMSLDVHSTISINPTNTIEDP